MSVITFQGAISGLKAAANLVVGFGKLHTMAEVQAKAVELQQVLLSAQSSALEAQADQTSLLQKISDLEKELAGMKAWEAEKDKYQLTPIDTGRGAVFVYSYKEGMEFTEPPHQICANCYQDGRKSILQPECRHLAFTQINCTPLCRLTFRLFLTLSVDFIAPLRAAA